MVIDHSKNQRRFLNFLKDLSSWAFLFFLSLLSSLPILLWLPKTSQGQWIFATVLLVAAIIIFILGAYWLIFRFLPARLRSYSNFWKIGLLGGFLLFGVWLSLNIFIISPPADLNPFISPYILKLAYRTSLGIVIGLLLLFLCTWLATAIHFKRQSESNQSLFLPSLKYVLPIGLIWGIYLLAFFPGMMSADSMDQWGQVLAGKFIDHHPAFHTMLIWLLTRIYLSPTIVAIAQIIALAIVAGLWFAFFETLGIPRWIIWTVAFIFAIIPVNGAMVVTLWKDVPFSTAVLGLTLIIARVIVTRGAWIASISAQVILGITVALIFLLRHDGVVLGVGSLLLLIIAYPRMWKAWFVASLICVFLYFGIRGPVYKWVGVEKPSTYTSSSLSLYSIAAYATRGGEIDQLVSSIRITSTGWNCSIWTNITPEMLAADIDRTASPQRMIGNLFRRLPNLISYDLRCARSMEWVIWDPNGEVRNPSHAEVMVDQNPYGIYLDSKIPVMQQWISNWVVKTSYNPDLSWFIWRPALFLYINLFLSAVLIIRNHNIQLGLLSIPILIQSISFSLILAEPNFRYHYAVYLVALITLPLFISQPILWNPNHQVDSIQTDS